MSERMGIRTCYASEKVFAANLDPLIDGQSDLLAAHPKRFIR